MRWLVCQPGRQVRVLACRHLTHSRGNNIRRAASSIGNPIPVTFTSPDLGNPTCLLPPLFLYPGLPTVRRLCRFCQGPKGAIIHVLFLLCSFVLSVRLCLWLLLCWRYPTGSLMLTRKLLSGSILCTILQCLKNEA